MERFIFIIAGMITGFLAVKACGLSFFDSNDKDSSMNMKGLVAFALCLFDIHFAKPNGFDELIITAIITFAVFVLGFYLIYGIMSLLKVSGEDTKNRRSIAFWINAAISTGINLLM